jgi:hypothetical protein
MADDAFGNDGADQDRGDHQQGIDCFQKGLQRRFIVRGIRRRGAPYSTLGRG